jgi:hypothetical protein
MDWDDVVDKLRKEVNFRQVKKCCGNCKHSKWGIGEGECLILTKKMGRNKSIGFGIWMDDICDLWERDECLLERGEGTNDFKSSER